MAGGLSLPRPIPREVIRREGERRSYSSDGLEDFVEIVAAVDDSYVEITVRREADDVKLRAAQSKKR